MRLDWCAKGKDFVAPGTTTFTNDLGSAESLLKVGMALMNEHNLYQQTACNFPIRVLSSQASSQPFTSCKFQEGLSLHCQSGEAS